MFAQRNLVWTEDQVNEIICLLKLMAIVPYRGVYKYEH